MKLITKHIIIRAGTHRMFLISASWTVYSKNLSLEVGSFMLVLPLSDMKNNMSLYVTNFYISNLQYRVTSLSKTKVSYI